MSLITEERRRQICKMPDTEVANLIIKNLTARTQGDEFDEKRVHLLARVAKRSIKKKEVFKVLADPTLKYEKAAKKLGTSISNVNLMRSALLAAALVQAHRGHIRKEVSDEDVLCAITKPSTHNDLAKALGVNRRKISTHIENLESSGQIELYTIRVGSPSATFRFNRIFDRDKLPRELIIQADNPKQEKELCEIIVDAVKVEDAIESRGMKTAVTYCFKRSGVPEMAFGMLRKRLKTASDSILMPGA